MYVKWARSFNKNFENVGIIEFFKEFRYFKFEGEKSKKRNNIKFLNKL